MSITPRKFSEWNGKLEPASGVAGQSSEHIFDAVSLLPDCSCGWKAHPNNRREVEAARAAWTNTHMATVKKRLAETPAGRVAGQSVHERTGKGAEKMSDKPETFAELKERWRERANSHGVNVWISQCAAEFEALERRVGDLRDKYAKGVMAYSKDITRELTALLGDKP